MTKIRHSSFRRSIMDRISGKQRSDSNDIFVTIRIPTKVINYPPFLNHIHWGLTIGPGPITRPPSAIRYWAALVIGPL